jgi:uncharacterized phage infection (PIP) family protein YhgE
VLHHHIQDSTRSIRDFINSKEVRAIAEIRRTHSESIQQLNEYFSGIMAHINDLDDNVDRLNGEVNRLNGGVDQINGKSDRLVGKVDRITAEIKRLSGEVMNIKTELVKKVEGLATVIQTDFVSRLDKVLFTNTEMSKNVSGLAKRFETLEEKQKSIIDFLGSNYGYAVGGASIHLTGHRSNMTNAAGSNPFTIPSYNPVVQGPPMPTDSPSFSPPDTAYGQWSTPNLLGGGINNHQFTNYMHANNPGQPQGVYGNSFRPPQGWTGNAHSTQHIQASRARAQAHTNLHATTNRDQGQNQTNQHVPGNAFSGSADNTQHGS